MKLLKIIIIFIIIGVIILINRYANTIAVSDGKILFANKFKGEVTNIYSERGYFVVYKNLENLQFIKLYCTSELALNLNLHDTIIKLANSNDCIIKNLDKKIKVKCYDSLEIQKLDRDN